MTNEQQGKSPRQAARERFCAETGFTNKEARELTLKADLAARCNEHECNGDPHPDARDPSDKNECANLWGAELQLLTDQMERIAKPAGFTVEYTGLRPCLKVGGRYEAKDGKIAAVETFVSKTDESPEVRQQTQAENVGWYAGITTDIFG